MNKLKKYRFSDLYEMSSGISTTKDQAGHGSPFLSFGTVFRNYYIPDTLNDLMDTNPVEQTIFSVKKGDIFITRTSETSNELAMSCVALKDYQNATFSGFLKRLRPKKEKITYDKFMAFYLRSNYFRKVITNNTIMTLRASFNEDMFSFLDLYLPNYDLQVKIGDFLFDIEEKIRTNNKINDNLEHQMKLLYDYWFTQFDFPDIKGNPYRSSGGCLIWNNQLKKNIPLGWEVKPLSSICEICLGGTPSTTVSEYWNGSIPWINSGEVSQFPVTTSEKRITQLGLENSPAKLMKKNTTVVSITGNIRASILAIDASANQSVVGISETGIFKSSFIYQNMLRLLNYYTSISTGNCQKHISKGAIEESLVCIPATNILQKYYNLTESAYKQINEIALENLRLTSLREWLLPMLMNGQATIED